MLDAGAIRKTADGVINRYGMRSDTEFAWRLKQLFKAVVIASMRFDTRRAEASKRAMRFQVEGSVAQTSRSFTWSSTPTFFHAI